MHSNAQGQFVPGSRRFAAKVMPNPWHRLGVVLGAGALMVVVGVLIGLLLGEGARTIIRYVLGLIASGSVFYLVHILIPRKIFVALEGDRLVIDEGRLGVFPLAGAAFGLWRNPGTRMVVGSVLHVFDGDRELKIGGYDQGPLPALRLDAPPVASVDVSLLSHEFQSLVVSLPPAVLGACMQDPSHAQATAQTIRCSLIPSFSTFSMSIPLLVTMIGPVVIAGLFAGLQSMLGARALTKLQPDLSIVCMVLFIASVVVASVLFGRRVPTRELELDANEMRLRDLKRGSILARAPLHSVRVWPAMVTYKNKYYSANCPQIVIQAPGWDDLQVGLSDARFGWRGQAPYLSEPRYVVGYPDWQVLLERLGLAHHALQIRKDPWG